jgi:hypothetical protein
MTYGFVLKSWAISLTSLAKGAFLIRRSTLFWCFLIFLSATVPGRYLCFFFCAAVEGADVRALLDARACFGTGPPVDLRAVCLVPLRAASANVLLGAWPPVLLEATCFVRALQVERLIFRLFLGFGMKTSTLTIERELVRQNRCRSDERV